MNATTPGSMLGGLGRCTRAMLLDETRTGAPRRRRSKDSPSRLRFRPQCRLTFRLGLATSSYGPSALLRPTPAPRWAHVGMYWRQGMHARGQAHEKLALCDL